MPDYKQGPTDPRFCEFRDAVFADKASAEKLLQKDPELIAVRSSIGETAMHYLAVEDELESVEWLLDRAADVNTQNDFGETPLMNAASLGYLKMCQLLLKRGADLEVRDASEETAISKAARSGEQSVLMMLLGLLPAGADINAYFDDITADITLKHGGEIAELLAARGLKGFYERYESSGPLES